MKAEKQVIGVLSLCNFGGLVVYEIDEEVVKFGYDFGGERSKTRTSKIRYSVRRGEYFNYNRKRVYIDEIMRTGVDNEY